MAEWASIQHLLSNLRVERWVTDKPPKLIDVGSPHQGVFDMRFEKGHLQGEFPPVRPAIVVGNPSNKLARRCFDANI
jgi:hypothetical protein